MSAIRLEDNKLICAFMPRMNTLQCNEDELTIEEKLKENPHSVEFDMSEVDYIASAFLNLCIKTVKALPEGKFLIVNVKPEVKKIFKIAGLDGLLKK